jgi:hypothetical protein
MWIKTSLIALGTASALAAATPAPTLAQGVYIGPGCREPIGVVLPPGPNSWPLNIPFGCSVPSLAHHDQRWSAGVTHLLHTSA